MKRKVFRELKQSAREALEHAQGKRQLKTTVYPDVKVRSLTIEVTLDSAGNFKHSVSKQNPK